MPTQKHKFYQKYIIMRGIFPSVCGMANIYLFFNNLSGSLTCSREFVVLGELDIILETELFQKLKVTKNNFNNNAF